MQITDLAEFLRYYARVKERTQRLFSYIPEDKIEWTYQEGKFTIGDIIRHLANIERWMYAESAQFKPSQYVGCGEEYAQGKAAIIQYYQDCYAASHLIFAQLTPEQLMQKCETPGKVKITLWKWLRAMVEHEIHHRGQLYFYLGMLGITTPPIYGLTSEEVAERSREAGKVVAVQQSATHTMQKYSVSEIQLLAGLGVEGDAHMGETVKHRSRVRVDPTQANLRQVHLIHQELHEELGTKGFAVVAGQMGENITTQGIDLLGLPKGTILHLGAAAEVEVTGLRNPCNQLNGIQDGLMAAVLDRGADGALIRKSGIMGIVKCGGRVAAGDAIRISLPQAPFEALDRV